MYSTANTVVVYAPQRLDLCTAPFLAQDLEAKIREDVAVVLDFTKTQFVDPASTNVLVDGFIKSRQRHARLSFRGVKPQVKVVLEMSGILKHFRRKAA